MKRMYQQVWVSRILRKADMELEWERAMTVSIPFVSAKAHFTILWDMVLVKKIIPKHMDCITAKLLEMGVSVEEHEDTLLIRRTERLQKTNIKTLPYPGFPTDMQPQITAVLSLAEGTSLVTESVWSSRYRYVDELKRMGANIQVDDKTAIITGVDHFTGAPIQAYDLRAGAAMVIAALAAHGTSEITQVQYIERGYEDIIEKLRALGANIQSVDEPDLEMEASVG